MKRTKPPRRKFRRIAIPALPTAFTLANGVCGLAAITVVTSHSPLHSQTDLAFYAGLLIFLGMIFDSLDGQIARMTKQTSQFGKELDSLCDVITFGVAPVFIMLTYAGVFQTRLLWGIGALYAVCAILRLARFNVQKDEHAPTTAFQGLPTPMAAGMVSSFAIATPSIEEFSDVLMPEATQLLGARLSMITHIALPILMVLLAWLMVSRIRYPHLARELGRRRSFSQMVELVFVVVATVTLKEFALPLLFGYFVFMPAANHLRVLAMARRQRTHEAGPVPITEEL